MDCIFTPYAILFVLFFVFNFRYTIYVNRLLENYDVVHDYRTRGPWLSWITKRILPILREEDVPLYNRIVLSWDWTIFLGMSMFLWFPLAISVNSVLKICQ